MNDVVVVAKKGAQRLRAGHPWVYRSDVIKKSQDAGIVDVTTERGELLGQAFFSPASNIMLRLVTVGKAAMDESVFLDRIRQAQERRTRLLPKRDAYRLVHGEADFLPGIFIDRYGDAFVLQTTCGAADSFEPLLIRCIEKLYNLRHIIIRDDTATRRREGLREHVTHVVGSGSVVVTYHEGNIAYEVDLLTDQKTGSFLDQTENHIRAGTFARGRSLDCFTYHGGFALQLAAAGAEVRGYDISSQAVGRATANAERAGLSLRATFHQADVFDVLPELYKAGERFDTIVCDPPAFASGKETVGKAMAAYKEINLRAMKLLAPNGILISCSCSGRITPQMFDDMLQTAAYDAHRAVHRVESHQAGADHPVLLSVPETDYLKCRVLQVV